MRKLITIALAGLALGAVHSALAQDATPPDAGSTATILVDPGAAPAGPVAEPAPRAMLRGFDQPRQARPPLIVNTAGADGLIGLAPSPDRVVVGPIQGFSTSPADLDTYFATKEYKDKIQITVRGGRSSAGRQFAGVAAAAGLKLAIGQAARGVRALVDSLDDDDDD